MRGERCLKTAKTLVGETSVEGSDGSVRDIPLAVRSSQASSGSHKTALLSSFNCVFKLEFSGTNYVKYNCRYQTRAARRAEICRWIIFRLGPPIADRLSTLASKSKTSWISSEKFLFRPWKSCNVSSLSWHLRDSASATARPET